jgi:YD repeat-containing protein
MESQPVTTYHFTDIDGFVGFSFSFCLKMRQPTKARCSTTPTYNTDGGLATFSGNSYTYDSLGRLTTVTNASGSTVFSYDPFGRRPCVMPIHLLHRYSSSRSAFNG